jgi:hypothetical protein
MQTLRDYNPVARAEFYSELRRVSRGVGLHEFAASVRKILRQSIDLQFSDGREKAQTNLAAKRGKADLAGFVEIREAALNATIDYAIACEMTLKLSEDIRKEKLGVLKALFATGTEVEELRHVIGRAEREVLSYWYSQLPDINGRLMDTMSPLSGSFTLNFEVARHQALLEVSPFLDLEEFSAKMPESKTASRILAKFYDGQVDVMYSDMKSLVGTYSSVNAVSAKLHDLENRLEKAQEEKRKVLEEYRTADPPTYQKLLLLDKILEYDNMIDHQMTQSFVYWRDPIAFNRLMTSLGYDDLIGLIRNPANALETLDKKENALDKSITPATDSEALNQISEYVSRLKSYTEKVYTWLNA